MKSPVVVISAPETAAVASADVSSHSYPVSVASSTSEEYSYLHFSAREHERSLLKGDCTLQADEQRDRNVEVQRMRTTDTKGKIVNGRQEKEKRFLQVVQDMDNARARECQRLEEQVAHLQQERVKDAEVRHVLP